MKAYIKKLGILTDDELLQMDKFITTKSVSKGDILLKENDICKELFCVKSGILRSYYNDYNAKEVTTCMAFSGELICSFSSFALGKPSNEFIDVLLDSKLEAIYIDDLENLYNRSINWQKVGRRIVEQQYIMMERHFQQYGCYT